MKRRLNILWTMLSTAYHSYKRAVELCDKYDLDDPLEATMREMEDALNEAMFDKSSGTYIEFEDVDDVHLEYIEPEGGMN